VSGFATRFAGAVRGFDTAAYLAPKEARRMDPFMHYGVAAGVQAVTDAGLDFGKEDPTRSGVIMGSGIGGLEGMEREMGTWATTKNPRKISPFYIPGTIINMISGNLSIRFGLYEFDPRDRSRDAPHPARRRRYHDRRRRRACKHSHRARRLQSGEGALGEERRAGEGEPPMGPRPRWLRDG
jgi:hypothetical protein